MSWNRSISHDLKRSRIERCGFRQKIAVLHSPNDRPESNSALHLNLLPKRLERHGRGNNKVEI